ncbi:MAG TPA: hypothetical protein VJ926_01585 [Patescibacteria group bacterium]|nr:hypothetical protein [Patescibacteria group bacterium]
MTLKNYLTLMIIATLACWGAFLFILNTVNPEITNWLGFILFYSSLFLAVSGLAAIVGFLIRFWLLKQKLAFYSVNSAFRQSFLFGLLVISTLLLLANKLFTIFNVLLLVVIITLIEFFLISHRKKYYEK